MKISDDTLRKIHDTSIVTVADKLGIKLYSKPSVSTPLSTPCASPAS